MTFKYEMIRAHYLDGPRFYFKCKHSVRGPLYLEDPPIWNRFYTVEIAFKGGDASSFIGLNCNVEMDFNGIIMFSPATSQRACPLVRHVVELGCDSYGELNRIVIVAGMSLNFETVLSLDFTDDTFYYDPEKYELVFCGVYDFNLVRGLGNILTGLT